MGGSLTRTSFRRRDSDPGAVGRLQQLLGDAGEVTARLADLGAPMLTDTSGCGHGEAHYVGLRRRHSSTVRPRPPLAQRAVAAPRVEGRQLRRALHSARS